MFVSFCKMETVSSDGRITYSKVKTFIEKQNTTTGRYRAITTFWNNTIILSKSHLIYGRKTYTEKFQPE